MGAPRATIFALIVALPAAALGLAATTPAAAQSVGTGIQLSLADWLEPWNAATGGWIAAPAGVPAVKVAMQSNSNEVALAPGTYDVYWRQNADVDPLLVAEGVVVTAGELTTVRAATGIRLEIADWAPLRDPEFGWFGAIPAGAPTFDFVNITPSADSLYLPPGEYDVFYTADSRAEQPPIWLGTVTVEQAFGGLGVEIAAADGGIEVVRVLPDGPADVAGIEAGDLLISVGDEDLTELELIDAVGHLRGPAESEAVVTLIRGKGDPIEVIVTRSRVEPERIVRATGGIMLDAPADAITSDGRWGVVFAGGAPADGYVNWSVGTAGEPLLLGPGSYDVYWNPDGSSGPQLVADGVAVAGELVAVSPGGSN